MFHRGILMQQRGTHQPNAAKVEVIAQRTFLIVYHRVWLALALLYRIAVAKDHSGMFVASHEQEALQHIATQSHRLSLQTQQGVTTDRQFGNLHHKLGAAQIVSHHKAAILRGNGLVCQFFTNQ